MAEPRNHPDVNLRHAWDQVIAVLKMASDMADDGAKLYFERPQGGYDPIPYLRAGAYRLIDRALKNSIVVDRERRDG